MQVSKWGNSLAVRIPAAVAEALNLKGGDESEVTMTGTREFSIGRDRSQEKAIGAIRHLAWPLPKGFKFDREEAHER